MNRRKILLLSPIPTHPRNAGHRERIYQLLRQMQLFGHDVHLLHVTLESDGDIEAMRRCWGDRFHLCPYDCNRTPFQGSPSFHATCVGKFIRRIGFRFGKTIDFPYRVDDWYDPACETMLAELHRRFAFEVVCVEYVFYSKILHLFDARTLKILDTHDVFGNRQKQFQQHGRQPFWFYTTPREERKALQRADVILAIQDHERRFFHQLVPNKQVLTVGHFLNLHPLPFRIASPATLLFLASANPVNGYGFKWFLRDIWPTVQHQRPAVRMAVAGSICAAIEDHPAVIKLGTFEEAQTIYAQADIVVSPILFGTGLKIKNIEALGYAKPLVTTLAGAEGLEQGIGTAFFATATTEEFAHRLIELITNSELRRTISSQAYCFAERFQQQNIAGLDCILQGDPPPCQNQ